MSPLFFIGAELCYYYGFSHDEVSTMNADTALCYWKALKALRSHEQRGMIEAAVYPHLSSAKTKEEIQRSLNQAVKHNVSDGDWEREKELEDILKERHGNGEN